MPPPLPEVRVQRQLEVHPASRQQPPTVVVALVPAVVVPCCRMGTCPRQEPKPRTLSPLTIKDPKCLSNVNPEQWSEIEVTADSGACETVMPPTMCAHIPNVPSQAPAAGVEYEVANGQSTLTMGTEGA